MSKVKAFTKNEAAAEVGRRHMGRGEKALAGLLCGALATTMLPCVGITGVQEAVAAQANAVQTSAAETGTDTSTNASAGTTQQAQSLPQETPAKTEVVYAKTDGAGSPTGIYVVNGFTAKNACEARDVGVYEKLTNLSTTEELSCADGGVAFTLAADTPFYYQGDLPASTALPWKVSLRYILDGAELSANELAGKSGHLKIELTVEPRGTDGAGDASLADFSDNYLVQAQATFANEAFSIESANDATLSRAGSSASVSCMVVPGQSKTFCIEGTANSFEFDGFQIAALPLGMAINVAEQDTGELDEKTGELDDAVGSAADGARALASGNVDLSRGIATLESGLSGIAGESGTLASRWESVHEGISSVEGGAAQLAEGSDAFSESIDTAAEEAAVGASMLEEAQAAYQTTAQAAQAEIAQTGTVSAQTFAAVNEAAQALAQASGGAGAYQALVQVQDGYAELGAGIDALAGGAGELAAGADAFSDGLGTYTDAVESAASGSGELFSGAAELAEGANSLSDGMEELHEETGALDEKVLNALQDKVDELLGSNFTPRSFVAPENTNVEAVQFVYVTPQVHVAQDKSDSGAGDNQTTLPERIAAIFTRLFGADGA